MKSSRLGFIFKKSICSQGAAIGLGAIWKFPYVTGTSGGGAFFALFVLFTIFIGLPLLLANLSLEDIREKKKRLVLIRQLLQTPGMDWQAIPSCVRFVFLLQRRWRLGDFIYDYEP